MHPVCKNSLPWLFPPPTSDQFVSYFIFGQLVRIWDLESPYCGEIGTAWGRRDRTVELVDLDGIYGTVPIDVRDLEPVWQ